MWADPLPARASLHYFATVYAFHISSTDLIGIVTLLLLHPTIPAEMRLLGAGTLPITPWIGAEVASDILSLMLGDKDIRH